MTRFSHFRIVVLLLACFQPWKLGALPVDWDLGGVVESLWREMTSCCLTEGEEEVSGSLVPHSNSNISLAESSEGTSSEFCITKLPQTCIEPIFNDPRKKKLSLEAEHEQEAQQLKAQYPEHAQQIEQWEELLYKCHHSITPEQWTRQVEEVQHMKARYPKFFQQMGEWENPLYKNDDSHQLVDWHQELEKLASEMPGELSPLVAFHHAMEVMNGAVDYRNCFLNSWNQAWSQADPTGLPPSDTKEHTGDQLY